MLRYATVWATNISCVLRIRMVPLFSLIHSLAPHTHSMNMKRHTVYGSLTLAHNQISFTRWIHTILNTLSLSLALVLAQYCMYPGLFSKAETFKSHISSDSSIFLSLVLFHSFLCCSSFISLRISLPFFTIFFTASSSVSKCSPAFLPNGMKHFFLRCAMCCKKKHQIRWTIQTSEFFVYDSTICMLWTVKRMEPHSHTHTLERREWKREAKEEIHLHWWDEWQRFLCVEIFLRTTSDRQIINGIWTLDEKCSPHQIHIHPKPAGSGQWFTFASVNFDTEKLISGNNFGQSFKWTLIWHVYHQPIVKYFSTYFYVYIGQRKHEYRFQSDYVNIAGKKRNLMNGDDDDDERKSIV